MTLTQAAAPRQLKHRRPMDVPVFSCGHGLREIGATPADTPTRPTQGRCPRGQPFQFDRRHALRGDGEIVRLHQPRWHRAAAALTTPDNDH